MKKTYKIFALLFGLLTLASCGDKPAKLDETAGVVRRDPESVETAGNSGSGTAPVVPEAGTGTLSWTVTDGVYSYTFPKRDDSGMVGLNEMKTFSRAMFEDQPDDWFFGKTVRDDATDEVTVVWERSEKTLAKLEEYGAIYRGNQEEKVVYLTFDNGYETGTTARILDVLKEKKVPATFFVNGHYVESAPEMIERMLAEGHIVGNHCVNHYDLSGISVEKFVEELEGLEKLYYAAFPDAPPMIYFRPPSGNCNEWVLKMADMMGYTTVMWSWAYLDYDTNNQPTVASAMAKVKEGLHNGCVYLLHPESETNTTMLGEMIDWIRGEGYEFMPLPAIALE